MILLIDTTTSKKIFLVLIKNKNVISFFLKKGKGEKLLFYIDQFLKKNKVKKLKGIFVVNKDGSSVSLRMGLAIANSLAYFLKIPIAGIKKKEVDFENLGKLYKKLERKIVLPVYNK